MAIRAGKLLADRLFGGSDITMDYDKVDFYINWPFPSPTLFKLCHEQMNPIARKIT